MRAWIDDIFSEEKILKTLLIIALLFFIMLVVLVIKDYNCEGFDFKELSNWVQAFIAIWTLLAVIYTAKKAYLASEKSNNISNNSAIISERSYMNDIIRSCSGNYNKIINDLSYLVNKYLEACLNMQHASQHYIMESRRMVDELKSNIIEKDLFQAIQSIEKQILFLDSCIYQDIRGTNSKEYYREIIILMTDMSVIEELKGKEILEVYCRLNCFPKKTLESYSSVYEGLLNFFSSDNLE